MGNRKAIAVICVLAVVIGCLTGCFRTAGKGKMAYTPSDPPHHTVAEETIAAHENYVSTPIQPDEDGLYTYVFAPKVCVAVFSDTPRETVTWLGDAEGVAGTYVSIVVDEQGALVLTLHEEGRQAWLDWALDENLHRVLASMEKQKKKWATVSEDYKAVVYEATSESSYNVGILLPFILVPSFFMQVNNGVPPEDFGVELTLMNYDTGKILWQGHLPGDTFRLEEGDWDV